MLPRMIRVAPLLAAGILTLVSPVRAQQTLCVVEKDKLVPVVRISDGRPWVMKGDKPAKVLGTRLQLAPADEFLPLSVTVRQFSVSSSTPEIAGTHTETQTITIPGGAPMTITTNVADTPGNRDFISQIELESDFRLEDVFLAVEIPHETTKPEIYIFVDEVGTLEAHKARLISKHFPIGFDLGVPHATLHVFVRGHEVFQTRQPVEEREAALDRMIAKRVARVQQAAPKLLFGPPPVFPAALRAERQNGRAVVSFRIDARGAVLEPAVVEATHPAFGDAALATVRGWRFIPKVENGKPVETRANLPIEFTPPPAAPDKS